MLVLEYKKRNDRKIFHSSSKPIASDSDIDKAFKSMHKTFLRKTKTSVNKDWIVSESVIKHSIKIFEC